MLMLLRSAGVAGIFLLTSCVTINVYFPAAAAQDAADQLINRVWGEKPGETKKPPQSALPLREPFANVSPPPRSNPERPLSIASRVIDLLIPSAYAQANFDISTPAINTITERMAARRQRLFTWLNRGAVGLTANGLLTIRDPKAVPLKSRNQVAQLVAQDNADRNALYREVAHANGHAEWEAQIRDTFAQRWVAKAAKGWWYQGPSGWTQK